MRRHGRHGSVLRRGAGVAAGGGRVAWLLIACVPPAAAHEPIFGVGPHTLHRGGLAVEVEAELGAEGFVNAYEFAYGLTPDLTLTGSAPLVLRTGEGGERRLGLGDVGARVKWRFLRLDGPGTSDALAIVAGVEAPTGAVDGELPLGSGSVDVLSGVTYGHESRRGYAWVDLRYVLTVGVGDSDPGDRLLYDAALGVRPWLLAYDQPDLVLLLEANGRRVGATRIDGVEVPGSVLDLVAVGPGIFLTWRNYALKAAVSLPAWWTEAPALPEPGPEGRVALEVHF